MHLTLHAQPAPWHQIHGSWQFVTSLKVKDITRLLMIHLWLILVKFKNSERYHSGLFILAFIFLISSFCVKVTVVLHMYLMACLTSCIHTCMCVCIQTHPNGTEGVIFRSELQNFLTQLKKKKSHQRKAPHILVFWMNFSDPPFFCHTLGSTLTTGGSCP